MIGRRIGGRYQILSKLGEGGMAIVYKAKDLILDRPVAVKILRSELSGDEQFIKRFHREAESVASLSHPNIVAIYDIGEEEDCYYIVMEYIHGMSLKEFIRDYSPISISDAVHLMKQIVLAIAHAHAHGIVHRDIKPHNILVDESEHVKVTDFGIALAVSGTTITYTHSIMGSAHYLSPEQAKGGKATEKSDIYALGIVMFELLTGKLPFPGSSPVSVALKHLNEPMPYPRDFRSEIPQSLENIIIRALAKYPEERFNSAAEMYDNLQTALSPARLNEPRLHLNHLNEHRQDKNEDEEDTIRMAPVNDKFHDHTEKKAQDKSGKPEGNGRKNNKAKKWLTITGILILLITAGLAIGLGVLPKLLYVDDVHIPDVTGKTYQQAQQALQNNNLKVVRTDRSSQSVKKGRVISQNPDAGSIVKAGSTVSLSVSKGPAAVKLDDFVGKDRDSVLEVLMDEDYKDIIWHQKESSDVPEGDIISQKPEAGSDVVPSDTVLELTYSTGKPEVTVPDLNGKPQTEARQLLEDEGLVADFSVGDYSDSIPKGHVLEQDPPPGSKVEGGTTIIVTLSKGAEPEQKEPKTIDQPIKIVYPSDGNSRPNVKNGKKPIHVQIYYTDANHNDSLFTDEKISETKTYTVPFTINPDEQGFYRVVIDQVQRKTGTVDYPE
ncbi:Stk1 family PASTA domain-containing Ser/Thr kinase [Sporolactobacillus sp. Y61]|jgi:serine/threonine-protein kinase|uniref:Serine/threonine-protein kinase PrkC n=1 Tax=Sporolactobacillus sp. Y61 TaxID=3160863 RepID=A0AAU8IDG1_9BACL